MVTSLSHSLCFGTFAVVGQTTERREVRGGGGGSMKRLWQGFKPGERKCILTTRALRWQ